LVRQNHVRLSGHAPGAIWHPICHHPGQEHRLPRYFRRFTHAGTRFPFSHLSRRFQLPLSGAALALPNWLSTLCRPFIAAYWGWSVYLKNLESTRHYDIVKQSTDTFIAPYETCMAVLAFHIGAGLFLAWRFVIQTKAR
jgi:hypothetical protein